MFTSKTIDGIGRFLQLGTKMNILPLRWDPKSRRLEIGYMKQRVIVAMIIIYMYWEAVYQLYRVVHGRRNKSVSLTQYMKLVDLFATRLTALQLQTIFFFYQEEVKYFGNQLLSVNTRLMKIYRQHHRDTCVKIFSVWYWFIVLHPAVTAAIYAADNKDGRYWHGALLPTGIQPYCVPLFTVVEYWISLFCELGCAFLGFLIVAYYRATPIWLSEMGTMASREKTKCREVVTLYRALQILNRGFNNAYSLIIAYGVLSLLVDLTITSTLSIRLSPVIGFPGGLNFPIGAMAFIVIIEVTVRPAGNMTSPSSEFLAHFSGIVSGKRFCSQRRGHVKNMEKEQRKAMKVKRCDDKTGKGSGNLVVASDRSAKIVPKHDGGNSDGTVAALKPEKNNPAASQSKARKRNPAGEDDIEVVRTEVVTVMDAPIRTISLELSATAKSLYPLVVNCFVFFEFQKSTIFDFYSTVLDQTISALLIA